MLPPKNHHKALWPVACGMFVIIIMLAAILQPIRKQDNPYYNIAIDNGNYYLVFEQEPNSNPPGNESINGSELWHGVNFDSLQEMYDDFMDCNFSESELSHIQALLERYSGKLSIPNLDNLCQPVLPENIRWDGGATWTGTDRYALHIKQDVSIRFSFIITNREHYERRKNTLTNYTGSETLEVIAVEYIEDRNATVYYTKSKKNSHESSFLVYVITEGDKEILVEEHQNIGQDPLSNYMNVYIRENGFYGSLYIEYDENRPTVEWLSSFGMEPYETKK